LLYVIDIFATTIPAVIHISRISRELLFSFPLIHHSERRIVVDVTDKGYHTLIGILERENIITKIQLQPFANYCNIYVQN